MRPILPSGARYRRAGGVRPGPSTRGGAEARHHGHCSSQPRGAVPEPPIHAERDRPRADRVVRQCCVRRGDRTRWARWKLRLTRARAPRATLARRAESRHADRRLSPARSAGAMTAMHADVIVVGAGSTGAAASALLAERGIQVICVERRPLGRAGARSINGVPRAAFRQAGVALPGPGRERRRAGAVSPGRPRRPRAGGRAQRGRRRHARAGGAAPGARGRRRGRGCSRT